VRDLEGLDRSDRLYAARVLRSRVKEALRVAERARPGSLLHDEALGILDDFDAMVSEPCIQALAFDNVALHCADILGLLEVERAQEPLAALLDPQRAPSRRLRRHVERALLRIQEAD